MRQLLAAPQPSACIASPCQGFLFPSWHDSNQSDRNKRYATVEFYKRSTGWVAACLAMAAGLLSAHAPRSCPSSASPSFSPASASGRTNRSVGFGIGIGIVLYLPLVFGKCCHFVAISLPALAKTPFALLICVHYRPAARRQILLPTLCVWTMCHIHLSLYVYVGQRTSCMCLSRPVCPARSRCCPSRCCC